MPLMPGCSKDVIGANVGELIAAGHSPDQAAAIAYAMAHESCHQARSDAEARLASLLKPVKDPELPTHDVG